VQNSNFNTFLHHCTLSLPGSAEANIVMPKAQVNVGDSSQMKAVHMLNGKMEHRIEQAGKVLSGGNIIIRIKLASF
jgi:hypothetical protein